MIPDLTQVFYLAMFGLVIALLLAAALLCGTIYVFYLGVAALIG